MNARIPAGEGPSPAPAPRPTSAPAASRCQADLAFVFIALIWGGTFPAIRGLVGVVLAELEPRG